MDGQKLVHVRIVVALSQRFGHSRVLGIPIPKSLAFSGDAQNAEPKLFQTGEKSGLSITNLRLNSVDAC